MSAPHNGLSVDTRTAISAPTNPFKIPANGLILQQERSLARSAR